MTEPTQPNGFFDDGFNPCITLCGQKWPIPLLAPRQNRHAVEAAAYVFRRMKTIAERKLAALDLAARASILAAVPKDVAMMGEEQALRNRLWAITDFPIEMSNEMDEELFEALATAVYWGLKRAHPQMPRDEFDDMPIGMLELIECIGTVAQQTGMMRKADPSADPLARRG